MERTIRQAQMQLIFSSNYLNNNHIWRIKKMEKEVRYHSDLSGESNLFNISNAQKDPNILQEMKDKVNKKLFYKLLLISINGRYNKILPSAMEQMLNDWAIAKYDFYILFGKNLSISKTVELDLDDSSKHQIYSELKYSFGNHFAILDRLNYENLFNNIIDGQDGGLAEHCKLYKRGMKFTKFIASYCQDETLNDKIANILGNSRVNSDVAISIDPCDYLTMSINRSGWRSCHRLGNGEYARGCGSLMLDDCTMIAFRWNGVVSSYKYQEYEIEWNSKNWRQCVYMDKNTCGIMFSRQYPDSSITVANEVRAMLEMQASNHLSVPNDWVIRKNETSFYSRGSKFLYHDVVEGYGSMFVKPKEGLAHDMKFIVGNNKIYCLNCGKSITDEDQDRSVYLCENC